MTTIFITGGNGFIGRAMRRVAQNSGGPEIVSVPRANTVDFLRGRLANGRRDTALVHLAWPNPGRSSSTANVATDGWREFLEWSLSLRAVAAELGAWFIGIGSGLEACDIGPGASLVEPYLSYVRHKSALMAALLSAGPSRMSWVRLHFMFGPFERSSRIVPSAIRACVDGTEFGCGRRDRRRRWLPVDDVARLLGDFAAAPVAGEWDIAGRQDLSFDELLSLVARAVGKPLRFSPIEPGTADAQLLLVAPANLSPLVPESAGRPESLLAGLRDYATWIAANRRGNEQRV